MESLGEPLGYPLNGGVRFLGGAGYSHAHCPAIGGAGRTRTYGAEGRLVYSQMELPLSDYPVVVGAGLEPATFGL